MLFYFVNWLLPQGKKIDKVKVLTAYLSGHTSIVSFPYCQLLWVGVGWTMRVGWTMGVGWESLIMGTKFSRRKPISIFFAFHVDTIFCGTSSASIIRKVVFIYLKGRKSSIFIVNIISNLLRSCKWSPQ